MVDRLRRVGASISGNSERGAGVFSMSIGLIMFLLMLTFAVQILFNLYATSVVSGLAIEAARDAAEFDPAVPSGPTDARLSEVEEQFESRVGPGASIACASMATRSLQTFVSLATPCSLPYSMPSPSG